MNQSEDQLLTILEVTGTRLEEIDPTHFSPKARERLKTRVDEFVVQLIKESGRIAKARQADVIAASYVDQASRQLFTGRFGKRSKLLGKLGASLLGAGISMIISMWAESRISLSGAVLSFVFGVVGTFLLLYHGAGE